MRGPGALLTDDQGVPGPLTNNQEVLEFLTDDQGAPGPLTHNQGAPGALINNQGAWAPNRQARGYGASN